MQMGPAAGRSAAAGRAASSPGGWAPAALPTRHPATAAAGTAPQAGPPPRRRTATARAPPEPAPESPPSVRRAAPGLGERRGQRGGRRRGRRGGGAGRRNATGPRGGGDPCPADPRDGPKVVAAGEWRGCDTAERGLDRADPGLHGVEQFERRLRRVGGRGGQLGLEGCQTGWLLLQLPGQRVERLRRPRAHGRADQQGRALGRLGVHRREGVEHQVGVVPGGLELVEPGAGELQEGERAVVASASWVCSVPRLRP